MRASDRHLCAWTLAFLATATPCLGQDLHESFGRVAVDAST